MDMSGIDKVSTITIAVNDEQEALRWFTEKLGFEKRLDLSGPGLRWLTVAPKNQNEVQFLLATWFPGHVGKNATWVVDTRDCLKTYEELKSRGVKFKQDPQDRPYGIEAVFQDLCGNTYALVEHKPIS
jgi:catechol 2,3-dioxygenase-like lactoylglutathione lyase family enzyme